MQTTQKTERQRRIIRIQSTITTDPAIPGGMPLTGTSVYQATALGGVRVTSPGAELAGVWPLTDRVVAVGLVTFYNAYTGELEAIALQPGDVLIIRPAPES